MTGRLWLLGGLAYGLVFLGLLTLNGQVIALGIPLVIYLVAAFLYGADRPELEINRQLSAAWAATNAPVVVNLKITNRGFALVEMLIVDPLPGGLEMIAGTQRAVTALAPGATLELEYTVRGQRGRYSWQSVQVQVSDPLGLWQRRTWLAAPGNLLILPEVARLRSIRIRPFQTHNFTGPIPSRHGGPGVSFFGVREYQLGDPWRWVNWRVTARHEQNLFTNEFELERIADVGIILDARGQCDIKTDQGSLFEHGVRATASLAAAFLSDGHRVGLLIYGRGREITFPGYGKVQRDRIMRALASAAKGDNQALESLAYLPTRLFSARSQIVFVSPLLMDDLEVLVRLRACGYQVLVISPDPVSFESSVYAGKKGYDLALRIARVERALMLRKLQRAGIQVVNWQVEQSLDQTVQTKMSHQLQPLVLRMLQ